MPFLRPDHAPWPALVRETLDGLRWWGLLWAVWTTLAAVQAAATTVALEGGIRVLVRSALLYGTTAWWWVATAPLLVAVARRVEWRGWRADRPHAARVIALHAVVLLGVAGLHTAWWRVALRTFANRHVDVPFLQSFIGRFDSHLFTYLAIVGAVYAAGHWRRLEEAGVRAAHAAAKLVATRLQVLMMQLQPHFLFNTLHSISELVHRDAVVARHTIARLHELLRFSFDRATRAEVPLRDELRFLETYMDIQRTRFGDRLAFAVDVAPDAADAYVPCLVLQPLVENAIRHGTAPLSERGHIRVSVVRAGDRLELRVRDNGRGPGAARREGQGLRNTRVRLAELYGTRQRLELTAAGGGGTVSVVSLPFREVAGPQDGASHDGASHDGASQDAEPRPASPDMGALEALPRLGDAAPRSTASRTALLVLGAWTCCGLLWTGQVLALAGLAGAPPPPLHAVLTRYVGDAWAWALMTAVIVPVVRRWPARREGWPGRLAIHAGIALAACTVLMLGRWLALDPTRPLVTLAQAGWIGWDVMTYCVVAAYTHAAHLARRRREREVRLAWLEADVARAELDVLKWHLQPRFLLETLDDIADASTTDADRADDMTTRLGTLLRLMMQHVGTSDSTVAAELEMARTYLDILRMRSGSRMVVTVRASPDALEGRVPGVLLLPVVEELIGAGGSESSAPALLHFTLEARCAGDTLVLTLRCTAAGAPVVMDRIHARLAARYGERSRVVVHDAGGGTRGVMLEIPFAPADDGRARPSLQLAGSGR